MSSSCHSSFEEGYHAFQAGSRFENQPTIGSKVFVAVSGREFRGVVQCERRLSFYDAGLVFGVELFDEVCSCDLFNTVTFNSRS
jgi:hypothetical protein